MDLTKLAVLGLFIMSALVLDVLGRKAKLLDTHRQGKLFSLFQVIRFPNEACNGTGNVVGTCYTDQECQTRNGMAMGACANGYGVCCAFTISCGQTSLENCTIFNDNTAPDMGVCTGTICPISPNICQLRLDFMAFQISGPVTDSIQVTDILNGFSISPITGSPPVPRGIPNSAVGQCLTDIFQVTSGSANNPPGICGMNSDEHMFVDADESCNALSFQFGGGNFNREFSIKITQYTCDSPNLAPSGCTQYFVTENGRGQVQTFNFAGGLHLSDQNQVMCVRQNRDSCRICWTTVANEDFDVSGSVTSGYGDQDLVTSCGAPMSDGLAPEGLDVLIIPSAKTVNNVEQERSRFCGRNSGLAYNSIPSGIQTICSQSAPFRIHFRSDSFESLGPATVPPLVTSEAINKDNGVRLIYSQDNNC